MIVKALLTIFLFLCFLTPASVYASSTSAYKEYLIEFDAYRAGLNDFKVARSEYLKFKTLTSQQTALAKTKQMLIQRSQLLRSYLQFINEKLNENTSIDQTNRQLYQTLIKNEVTFLNNHTGLIGAIGSIQDADGVSMQLASHYAMLQSNMYQTIVGLKISELMALDAQYQDVFTKSYTLIQNNKSLFSPEKQAILDRWLLQIQNKRDLFKQKIDEISKENSVLKSSSLTEITASFQRIQKSIAEAKQYLAEGSSFIQELTTSMQYGD
jgi:hypothetical protein